MPYIKKELRKVYNVILKEVVDTILYEEKLLERAELVGYYCETLLRHYTALVLPATTDRQRVINQKCLILYNLIKNKFRASDFLNVAGDLNYLMSAVIWGVEGDAEGVEPAKYGFRSMVSALLLDLLDTTNGWRVGRDARTIRMLRGVVYDVMSETYRRPTAEYEDLKIEENGDLWPLE